MTSFLKCEFNLLKKDELGRKWKKLDDDIDNIQVGKILRKYFGQNTLHEILPELQISKGWDGYIYGRAVYGFGLKTNMYRAKIFLDNVSTTFDECSNKVSNIKIFFSKRFRH